MRIELASDNAKNERKSTQDLSEFMLIGIAIIDEFSGLLQSIKKHALCEDKPTCDDLLINVDGIESLLDNLRKQAFLMRQNRKDHGD